MFSQETSAGFLWHLWRNSHLKRPIFVGTIQPCPGQLSGQTGCRSRSRNIHQHSGFVALLMATHLHYLRSSSCPFVSYFCHPMILNLRAFFKWSFPNGFPLFFQLVQDLNLGDFGTPPKYQATIESAPLRICLGRSQVLRRRPSETPMTKQFLSGTISGKLLKLALTLFYH
jgi:hypothetical protein